MDGVEGNLSCLGISTLAAEGGGVTIRPILRTFSMGRSAGLKRAGMADSKRKKLTTAFKTSSKGRLSMTIKPIPSPASKNKNVPAGDSRAELLIQRSWPK